MDELVAFASPEYGVLLVILAIARGADFLSTWVATPHLVLEANPVARRLGWRGGAVLNIAVCLTLARWPLPAVAISTTSLLVAARNFQSAWLMRTMGEHHYRDWMGERLDETPRGLLLFCLFAQALLIASVGGALIWFSQRYLIPFAVGTGVVVYAVAVLLFTLLSLRRARRHSMEF